MALSSFSGLPFGATQIAMAESGGNPYASNPNSSALGLYGFTEPTWSGLAQKYPNDGYTPANRTDPNMQHRALSRLTESEYLPALAKAGVPVTPASIYTLHRFGAPDGSALLSADPSAKASSVLGKSFKGIMAANPDLRQLGDNATVGDLLGNTAAKVGAEPPQAQGVEPGAEQATVSIPESPSEQVAAQAPADPEPQKAIEDPEEQTSAAGRLVRALALWGAGANGHDFAAGLGQGASNVMQDQEARERRSLQIKQQNEAIARQNYQEQVGSQQQRLNTARLLEMSRQQRADAIARLKQQGYDTQSAISLATAPGGSSVDVNFDPQAAYGRGTGASFEAPKDLEVANTDGTTAKWTQSFNRRTGQTVFTNKQTGEQQATLPEGAYDPSMTPQKEIMQQAQKDASAFSSQSQTLDSLRDTANQALSFLPYVRTGANMPAMVARGLSQASGLPVSGNDPSAQQAMEAVIGKLRTSALQQDRGLGALRMPEIEQAMKSTVSLSQNPQAIHYIASEMQHRADYADGAMQAWDDLPLDSPYRTHLGFNSFLRKYRKDTPYKALTWKDAQSSYQEPQADPALSSTPSPQTVNPAARIGPNQNPAQDQQQQGNGAAFTVPGFGDVSIVQ